MLATARRKLYALLEYPASVRQNIMICLEYGFVRLDCLIAFSMYSWKMSQITLSADLFFSVDISKQQQQTRMSIRFHAGMGVLWLVVMLLLLDVVGDWWASISISGSSAAAAGEAVSCNRNIN